MDKILRGMLGTMLEPTTSQFGKLQCVALHHLQKFEDVFYVGFFEYLSHIFGYVISDLSARYVSYQATKLQNLSRDIIEDTLHTRDLRS